MIKQLLTTTTSSVEGLTVKHYKGVVSARVVTGTDFFSDLFAGFSDFFGGRSGTYQNQLKNVYDEVMELLSVEAVKVGANAILGIRIDHDEISGKGKQMFMVTAMGTAVTVEGLRNQEELFDDITYERFESELTRHKIIKKVKNNLDEIENHLSSLIQYRIVEVMYEVYSFYIEPNAFYDDTPKKIMRYFSELDSESIDFLFPRIISSQNRNQVAKIIIDAQLVDYEWILRLMENESFDVQKTSLRLLLGRKKIYNRSDIKFLELIKDKIKNNFKVCAKDLGAERWECECGKVNKDSNSFCKSCEKDKQGFRKDEVSPEIAISVLDDHLIILKKLFNS